MSKLNKTPTANRLHIAIFGKRNMGKSTLINAITNQNLAIVSEHAGTTTDPVFKAMEILPIGPVVLIDTAGFDDSGSLGELRVQKTMEVIRKTDIALLVVDKDGFTEFDYNIIELLNKSQTEFIIVINKADENQATNEFISLLEEKEFNYIQISAKNKDKIEELKKLIIEHSPKYFEHPSILGDLVEPGDHIVMVVPIDTGMPKGRLILPQVQILRDILDNDCIAHTCKDTELVDTIKNLKTKPKLVITDSQAFEQVNKDTPLDITLTSFSILFARYKGDLLKMVEGAKILANLKEGDKALISEACTHHPQPDDIGRIKIPRWIREKINKDVTFDYAVGRDYPFNLKDYKLVIHCGACTLNRKEMLNRIELGYEQGVPVINYGLCIAYLHGIYDRALKPFPEVYKKWMEK
jgi:[FeFe] hydrogenase H-cluster maturation GTPase HydF